MTCFLTLLFCFLHPFCQISGKWAGPFTWKTHPSKNNENLFSFFFKPGSWPRPFYWKTHPIVNWRILGRDTCHITGKLIQTKKIRWMSFRVKWSGSWPHYMIFSRKYGQMWSFGHFVKHVLIFLQKWEFWNFSVSIPCIIKYCPKESILGRNE